MHIHSASRMLLEEWLLTSLASCDWGEEGTEMANGKRLDYYKDSAGEWRWKLYESSDETGASSEGYKNLSDARHNVRTTLEDGEYLDANAGGLPDEAF
jgi:uncharacterized protein YegP (UPF0339 family)